MASGGNKDDFCFSESGIEAHDLASLLCRFEEATSSASAVNVQEERRNLMQKVKNARNNPVVTQTAIPSRLSSIKKKNFQHSILNPQSNSTASMRMEPSYEVFERCLTGIGPTSLSSKVPTLLIQITAPSKIQEDSGGIYSNCNSLKYTAASTSFTLENAPNILNSDCGTDQPRQQWLESKHVDSAVSDFSKCGTQSSVLVPNILNRDYGAEQPKQQWLVSKHVDSTFSDFIECSTQSSVVVSQASELMSGKSLPETSSCAQMSTNPIPSQFTLHDMAMKSTSADSIGKSQTTHRAIIKKKKFTDSMNCETSDDIRQFETQAVSHGTQNVKAMGIVDHNYCLNGREQQNFSTCMISAQTSFEICNAVPTVESSQSTTTKSALDLQRDISFLSNIEVCKDYIDFNSKDCTIDDQVTPSCKIMENVFEEGEVLVDASGNNSVPQDIIQFVPVSRKRENLSCNQPSLSISDGKVTARRKPHKQRQRAEFSSSPIQEDTNGYFDKIPSYYTALSIPTKPTKTSVFASTTKTIGSTDHLDFLDVGEPVDDGHYDKVPAHRRCFTNTIKDVEFVHENSSDHDMSSQVGHISANQFQDPASSCEQQLNSDYLGTEHKFSRQSHSPAPSSCYRRSRSVLRHSRSSSRRSCSSGSSRSNCSTCSSRSSSVCSTCSWSSRSRSPLSSDNEEDSLFQDYRKSSNYKARPANHKGRHHSSTEQKMSEKKKAKEEERVKAMVERRVVYVGKIPDGYTKSQLYQRFECFGEIKEVKLNFREHGDNYGFVTFTYACDAVAAKEKGNNVKDGIKFDLCFGGRRQFCPDQYADLDGNNEVEEEYAPMPKNLTEDFDYAALLKQHSSRQKNPF